MRNLVAGLVFVISAVAFAGARTPADEDAHRTAAVEEPVVESTCEHCVQAAEDLEPIQKRARPAWLTDYSTHIGIIGVLSQFTGSPPREEAEPVERSPFDALMDSLSPGVRASYEGWLLERKHARRSERLREESTTLDEEAVEVGAVDIGALDDELYTGSQTNTGISRSVRAWYASYGGYTSMIVGQSSAFFSGDT